MDSRSFGRIPSAVLWSIVLALLNSRTILAHEHGQEIDPNAPIDSILWLHIVVQILVWGFIWPVGMVFGLARSRWHVPLQVTGFALTTAGYIMGHKHGGRRFMESIHGKFASVLIVPLLAQFCVGVYLKLHINERTIRPYVVVVHGILGKSWPILGWTQMLFGALVLRGYCYGGNLGQCLAHYIMGSAFVGYGILLAIAVNVGGEWLKRRGRSQEWFDSWVIMLWGIVNTFTEHHGGTWSHKDMQHTSLGVLWWAGGALGIWLARNGKRNVIPAVIVMMTGWAMSAHEQQMPLSTKVHSAFGVILISAGLARIIEICFVLFDGPSMDRATENDERGSLIKSFQHVPPFLLVAGGILFMSATDEEIRYGISAPAVYHVMTVYFNSLAFSIYLYTCFLLHLALTSGRNAQPSLYIKPEAGYEPIRPPANGHVSAPPMLPGDGYELYALGDEDGV